MMLLKITQRRVKKPLLYSWNFTKLTLRSLFTIQILFLLAYNGCPLCLASHANEIGRNEHVSSICTDITKSATDWWCKPSPYSLLCDLWLLTPRGVKLITLWLVWPLLWKELDWRMTTALVLLATRWPNCGQRADHPNPRGMWPWPRHTLCG